MVGEWIGAAGLAMQYRSPDVSSSSHCDASLSIREQSQGTFSGVGGLNGSSLNSDKQCPGSFAFTAAMTPDGTIVSFRPDQRFRTEECLAVSDVSLSSGTASAAGFRIELTDRAMCRWPPYDASNPFVRETNRTWAITIDVRRGAS